jgi:hypothetical protein
VSTEIKRSFTIPDPMHGRVRVIFTEDMAKSVKKIVPEETFVEDVVAYCADFVPGAPIIVLKKDAALEDVVHEADHAAFCILAGMGILVTTEDNEAHAYVLEYIVRKVLKLKEKLEKV